MRIPVGPQTRRVVFGAVDYGSGQMFWDIQAGKNGTAFAAFLGQLAAAWPDDQMVLVMDNASYHRLPAVRAWWAQRDGRITPFWLPVYAPQFNLIERVWRYLKQKLACHRFWCDVDGLDAVAGNVLNRLEAHFHQGTGPSIFLRQDL